LKISKIRKIKIRYFKNIVKLTQKKKTEIKRKREKIKRKGK
jgi:hypothetical protein